MENSVKVPLTGSMKVGCGLFSVFGIIILYGIYVLLTQQIYMEDDTVMPFYFKLIFVIIAFIVESGIIFMVLPLWKRIIKKTGAMTITSRGIENTFTVFTLFAFWTTFKIDFIPWEAMDLDSTNQIITINFEFLPKQACGKIARLLLISGFNYNIGKISFNEIKEYRDKALASYQV